jgi:hypothetical protein
VKNRYAKKIVLLFFIRVLFILTVVSKHSEDGVKRAAIELNQEDPNMAILKQL